MSVQSDFAKHLIALRAQSTELSEFFDTDDWFKRGLPDDAVLPQMTLDNYWAVPTPSKERLTEITSIFVSVWFKADDITMSDQSEDITRLIAELTHLKRTSTHLFIECVSRQKLPDPKSTKERIRMQFRVSRI